MVVGTVQAATEDGHSVVVVAGVYCAALREGGVMVAMTEERELKAGSSMRLVPFSLTISGGG